MSERDQYPPGVPCWVDTLQPDPELPLDDDGAPAHWSVDFWIDDADVAAAKAASLGGRVVGPPYDTPGFRSAVLADPQGAVFSVSKLIPAP